MKPATNNADFTAQKFQQMTSQPVSGLILRLSVPAVLSMLVSAIYNLADTAFISYIGETSTKAVAAAGVVFSYQTICNAFGFFFGHGSGNFISRALGRKDYSQAAEMASTGVFSSFLTGCLLALVALLFSPQILSLLGTREAFITEAGDYFFYIALATPLLTTQLTLNNQLRLLGNARLGMIGIMTGALLNIILDPIFIFVLGLGIKGAGLATAISLLCGCLILWRLTYLQDGIPPKPVNFKPTATNYREILAGGLPSMSRQALNATAMVILNRVAVKYGTDMVAALSIVNRLIHLTMCISIGIGQGFQPVCGFNYGARLYPRVRQAYYFAIKLNTLILTTATIILALFAEEVIGLFGSSAEAAVIACKITRCYLYSLPFLGFCIMTEMILQNTRQTIQATILSGMRQGIALVPSLLIMEYFWGQNGVIWSQTMANFLALFVTIPMCYLMVKKLSPNSQL